MKELILVRHAETDHTLQRRFSGVSNPHLCEFGKETADFTAEFLKNHEFDTAFCSPWNRTKQTMQAICKSNTKGIDFIEDARLAEVNFGDIEGMLFTDLELHYPGHAMDFKRDWQTLTLQGGDNLLDYYTKASAMFKELEKNEGRTLVVTHTGFIGSAIAFKTGDAENLGIYSQRIPPGSVWKFDESGFEMLFARSHAK